MQLASWALNEAVNQWTKANASAPALTQRNEEHCRGHKECMPRCLHLGQIKLEVEVGAKRVGEGNGGGEFELFWKETLFFVFLTKLPFQAS